MLDLTRGPAREKVDSKEASALRKAGTLVTDDRRRRPLYFDGRFLAARDLIREQSYFLARQSDLGRAGGAGVVNGLLVMAGDTASSIRVKAGHGVTPLGEIVVLPKSLVLDLVDILEIQRLDAAFGLIQIPRAPARNRSGLYIVALRPVEYTANPIASYPTSITGTRSVEDGDIIEAVAVTLVPYADAGEPNEPDLRRAQVAREIFIDDGWRGLPAGVLPLAMLALERGVVKWVDSFMVRREVGAEHGDVLGLGFAPRALREAHLLQYDHHLSEVLRGRDAGNGGKFAASEYFRALPPAGRMPAAAIDPRDFTQTYFPAEVDVDLSIIPEDELSALLEESLLLPPIDLTLKGEQLESTSVLALIPVPRQNMRFLINTLKSLSRPLRPAAPGLVARRKPLEVLQGLRLPRLPMLAIRPEDLVDSAWRKALVGTDMLWYVRRRNLQYKSEVAGIGVRVLRDEFAEEEALGNTLKELKLTTRVSNVKKRGSTAADAEIVSLLASPKFALSKTLMHGAICELEAKEKVNRASALKVSERFADPRLGEGTLRLEKANPVLKTGETIMRNLAQSRAVPELDRLGRLVDEKALPALAKDLEKAAEEGSPEEIKKFIEDRLKEVKK